MATVVGSKRKEEKGAAANSTASFRLGFMFSPTEEQLIDHYLRLKNEGSESEVQLIGEVNFYDYEPWDLPELSVIKSDQREWFFFRRLDDQRDAGVLLPSIPHSKIASNLGFKIDDNPDKNTLDLHHWRTDPHRWRTTTAGYWESTSKDFPIRSSRSSSDIGMRKTLVFYKGHVPNGTRTDWIMHEYRATKGCLAATSPQRDKGGVSWRPKSLPSLPSLILPEKRLSQAKSKNECIPTGPFVKTPSSDGYNWRKYGEKRLLSGAHSYYRCASCVCCAKKKHSFDHSGLEIEVLYKGRHNHDIPCQDAEQSPANDAELRTGDDDAELMTVNDAEFEQEKDLKLKPAEDVGLNSIKQEELNIIKDIEEMKSKLVGLESKLSEISACSSQSIYASTEEAWKILTYPGIRTKGESGDFVLCHLFQKGWLDDIKDDQIYHSGSSLSKEAVFQWEGIDQCLTNKSDNMGLNKSDNMFQ